MTYLPTPSAHAQYLMERESVSILEAEEGFAVYLIVDPNTVYLRDIWVKPEFRKSRIATELADKVAELCKAKGCIQMMGSVVPKAPGSTRSLKVLLAYGMQLFSCQDNIIWFKKPLV